MRILSVVHSPEARTELFARLGTRRASSADAEVVLSGGYTPSVKLAQQFACVTEVFFATLLTLTSRVVFTVDGMDMDVDAFAFQLGSVVVVAATFARASAARSVFLMAYEVVRMRREEG